MEQNKATSKQHFTLRGVVSDKEIKPIPEAFITVYRPINLSDISKQGEYNTKQNGSYSIKFEIGNSVIMRFDSNNWHPALINNLSGSMGHQINIVMQKAGHGYGQDELLEILSTYERLYFIDEASHLTTEPIPLDERRKRYNLNLGMIKYINPFTRERYEQVLRLYRKK